MAGVEDDNEPETAEQAEAKAEEVSRKEEEEILAKNKDVSLLLQHSKLKKLAEARQVGHLHEHKLVRLSKVRLG